MPGAVVGAALFPLAGSQSRVCASVLEHRQDRVVKRVGGPKAKTVSLRLDNGVWVLVLQTPKPAPGYRGVASIQLWISAGAAVERQKPHAIHPAA